MPNKKEKLSKKELETIAFRDSVTKRLKKLDETDSATRKKRSKLYEKQIDKGEKLKEELLFKV